MKFRNFLLLLLAHHARSESLDAVALTRIESKLLKNLIGVLAQARSNPRRDLRRFFNRHRTTHGIFLFTLPSWRSEPDRRCVGAGASRLGRGRPSFPAPPPRVRLGALDLHHFMRQPLGKDPQLLANQIRSEKRARITDSCELTAGGCRSEPTATSSNPNRSLRASGELKSISN